MRTTRRKFIQASALATAGLAFAGRRVFGQVPMWPPNLQKFVAPLPGIGPTGIPLAKANTKLYPGTDFYRIVLGQYRQQMHPDLPARGTKLWGYADMTHGLPDFRYLGPAIVATKGKPVRVNFTNLLPRVHPLPIDTSIPGAETGQKANRAAVHLHGGFVPWPSDGGPYHWFAPDGTHGPSVVKWLPNFLGLPTDDYWYPNAQSARLLWYHDHAVGITRLNAYAGLAAPYVLIDDAEVSMFGAGGSLLADQLPGIPLVLQDKSFKAVADEYGREGDLDYPVFYGPREDLPAGATFENLPIPSAVPEFFSDNIVINGMAYPFLELTPGAHRFRLLNGTQSRVFNLQLYREDRGHPGEVPGRFVGTDPNKVFVPSPRAKGPDFIVIGTEGGFLPKAAVVPSNGAFDVDRYYAHDPGGYGLVLAGAERADVLIDFSGCEVGDTFILYNDAGSPFPDGGDRNLDYYTGNPDGTGGPEGFGPNTRTMMRIEIVAGDGQPMPSRRAIDRALADLELGLLIPDYLIGGSTYDPADLLPPGADFKTRNKTLSEGFDKYGRLNAMLGTDDVTNINFTKHGMTFDQALAPNGQEDYEVGATEVWDIYNTTGDTHPIHFHLVNVQIIGRATFATVADKGPDFGNLSGWAPPDPDERGWKETVRMDPGQVTRVIMKIELPPDPVVRVFNKNRKVTVPKSPRTGGYEYVWHCHILEHEEHDMMRPFVVRDPRRPR